MQVIGLCRFSYPAIGGFQVEHHTTDERIRYLYQPERMQERFRLFETVALPCLREQTDAEFDLIVVIGDSLPDHYRDQLRDLVADMPQVRILSQPPRRQREVMKQLLQEARRDPAAPCLQFRHDDDDAVSVDFVARLRQLARDCDGLVGANRTVAFDFNRGYVAELGADGIAATEVVRPLNVAALGMYVAAGCRLTVMNFAHHKIGRFMPVVSLTDTPMWVRTHNGFNDSRQSVKSEAPVTPLSREQEADFAARFAIDADLVRSRFGI